MDETGVKFLGFFVGTINSKRHFIRKNMAMWYKLTSTVRRRRRDSKSLYYFFFRPRGRFVFQSKISGKCFYIHILYLLFHRNNHILARSRRSACLPTFAPRTI